MQKTDYYNQLNKLIDEAERKEKVSLENLTLLVEAINKHIIDNEVDKNKPLLKQVNSVVSSYTKANLRVQLLHKRKHLFLSQGVIL
ncbi:MAG: hypothetical protein J6T74_09220 [Clostridia bacterium]|nr:hypothetical protein [Clostridia bacterium]